MTKVDKSIFINAPVERVFSFMDAVERQPEWLPSMIEVWDIVGWPGLGTRWKWNFQMAGIRFEGRSVVSEYVQNERIVVETKGGIDSNWLWFFRPEANGTRVDLTVEYDMPGSILGRLANKLVVEKLNEREAESALVNIKTIIEGEPT